MAKTHTDTHKPAKKAGHSLKKTRFLAKAPEAKKVAVAGSFNNWQPLTLEKLVDGSWGLELELEPATYEYRYVINGQWGHDPLNVAMVSNPFGGFNSVIVVD